MTTTPEDPTRSADQTTAQGPTATAEVIGWSAIETAKRVRNGDISASAVAIAHLEHLEARNPTLNAMTRSDPQTALRAAEAVDQALGRGDPVGVLAGVPVTVKDNVDVEGESTPNGLRHLANNNASVDHPAVAALRAAGAVVIGRTNTPEFSWRWHTDNPLFGATQNPRSPGRTPGGSSGGASAALAAGIGCLAMGNDAGGSVRWPANCTGTAALRPTVGRIASHNVTAPGERPLGVDLVATQGPMGRTVADIELMFGVLSAPSWRDPNHVPGPIQDRTRGSSWVGGHGRFGLHRGGGARLHPAVATALDRAAVALESAGLQQTEPALPDLVESATAWATLINADFEMGARASMEQHGSEAIQLVLAEFAKRGGPPSLAAVYRALAVRATQLRDWMQAFSETVDVVVMPVGMEPAWPAGDDLQPGRMSQIFDANTTMVAINLLGLPAAAVGVGDVDGIPVGVQIIGPRFSEHLVLATASVIEAAYPPPPAGAEHLT